MHSLHAEVQGQWPAPLYPMLMVAAAAAAERATGWLGGLRAAAAPVAFAAYAAILAFMLAPSDGGLPIRDPAASLRGWPAFTGAVEAARQKAGAAWVGAPTYGIAAQLAAAPRIRAPATEIFERERYTFETPAERADFRSPAWWCCRCAAPACRRCNCCFADVPGAPGDRPGRGTRMTPYTVLRVAGPNRDVERIGCYRPPQARP